MEDLVSGEMCVMLARPCLCRRLVKLLSHTDFWVFV